MPRSGIRQNSGDQSEPRRERELRRTSLGADASPEFWRIPLRLPLDSARMESTTTPVRADIGETSSRTLWLWAAAVLALGWALQLYTIWSRPFAPLVDLPNHMARHY